MWDGKSMIRTAISKISFSRALVAISIICSAADFSRRAGSGCRHELGSCLLNTLISALLIPYALAVSRTADRLR